MGRGFGAFFGGTVIERAEGGVFKKVILRLIERQQRCHLVAQRLIAPAGFGQISRAPGGRQPQAAH